MAPTHDAVNLRRREADLAVRMFRDDHDGLALRKLGQVGWSLFATDAYLRARSAGSSLLDGHTVIGYTGIGRTTPGAQWLEQHASADSIRLRIGTPRAALEAALTDAGVCAVPCYLAEREPGLVRMTDQIVAHSDVYAVFLPERRTDARLRVVIDALVEMFAREGVALAGGRANACDPDR